jgi:hypothetical protein
MRGLGYLHPVEEDMKRASADGRGQATVIFIDDLDRRSPPKVGEVIEAMNLFCLRVPELHVRDGHDAEVVAASMEVAPGYHRCSLTATGRYFWTSSAAAVRHPAPTPKQRGRTCAGCSKHRQTRKP